MTAAALLIQELSRADRHWEAQEALYTYWTLQDSLWVRARLSEEDEP